MNVVLWLPRALWKIYYMAFFVLSLILLYPAFRFFVAKESRFPKAFVCLKIWAWLLQIFGGIILWRRYHSPVPKSGPYVICSNHSSYLDIILMYRVFTRHFVFLGKSEVTHWPFFRVFFTSGLNIPVYRNNAIKAARAIDSAKKELRKGRMIALFPEATIPPTVPHMKRFKNGAFKLAIEEQVPIIPVTFLSNWKRLQGSVLLKGKAGPGLSTVLIHEIVETKGMSDSDIPELRQRIFDIINKPIIEKYGTPGH